MPLAMIGYPIAIWLIPFYSEVTKFQLSLLADILLLARLTDVITDPVIGLGGDGTAPKNPAGSGRRNNQVYSLQKGIDIITNPVTTRINLLAVPGARDSYVTDHASDAVKKYGLAMYVMDIPEYDKDTTRLYDDSANRSDVGKTLSQFESRAIDNNYE